MIVILQLIIRVDDIDGARPKHRVNLLRKSKGRNVLSILPEKGQ